MHFMALPVPSFGFHSSSMTVKLVILHVMASFHNELSGTCHSVLIAELLFRFVLLGSELNIAGNEV